MEIVPIAIVNALSILLILHIAKIHMYSISWFIIVLISFVTFAIDVKLIG